MIILSARFGSDRSISLYIRVYDKNPSLPREVIERVTPAELSVCCCHYPHKRAADEAKRGAGQQPDVALKTVSRHGNRILLYPNNKK
jgi:3-oxoacyl-[acyl-carrier-protein] synthase III